MAHKTFISYKYSEACGLRDRIIDALGNDATYYQGETSDSPNLSDATTERIKEKLKDMIYDTSVTIVIISPNMTQSDWIDWEIEYSLGEYMRDGTRSHTNGIVGVVMNGRNGDTSWIKSTIRQANGYVTRHYEPSKMYRIINDNRFNKIPRNFSPKSSITDDPLMESYISLIDENEFLRNPFRYIENAYDKSQHLLNYEIHKTER